MQIKNCNSILVMLLFFLFLLVPVSNAKKKSIVTNKDATVYWLPVTLQFSLYNKIDSVVMASTISYDSILAEDDAKKAYLWLKNDTLYEYIEYDSCFKTSATSIVYEGSKIHYVKQPLLLSNSANGYKKDEYLSQNDSTLESTMVVYLDVPQVSVFKKSITKVTLKKVSGTPVTKNTKLPVCN